MILVSCKIKPYKIIWELDPTKPEKPICYYKRLADMSKKNLKCYAVDAKLKDGSFRFNEHMITSKRRLREIFLRAVKEL